MKKRILLMALAACMVFSFTGCMDFGNRSSTEGSSTTVKETKTYIDLDSIPTSSETGENKDDKCKIELDVLVEENLIFSKYNVDVIVDGTKLKTLSSSRTPDEFDLMLTKGSHTFRFEKSGDSKVIGEMSETVAGDGSFQYRLKRHNDNIEVTPQIKVELNVVVEKNIAMAKYAVDFYVDLSEYTTLTDNNAGNTEKIVVLLDKGTHTFGFAKNGDYSILASMEETFSENTTFEISIKRHKKEIEIKSKKK